MRGSSFRAAFIAAVKRVIESDKPVQQPALVKRIARKIDAGCGIIHGRGR